MKSNVFYEISINEKMNYDKFMIEMIDEFIMDWYVVLGNEDDKIPCMESLVRMVLSEVQNSATDLLISLRLGRNISELSIDEINDFIDLKADSDLSELLNEEGYRKLFNEDEIVKIVFDRIEHYSLLLLEKHENVIINSPEWWDVW